MAFFPILIDWQDMPVMIAGGQEIALHKAELLAGYGADVTVVSSSFCEGLKKLPVRLVNKRLSAGNAEEEMAGKALVVDATGNPQAEEILSAYCRNHGIPYNCAGHGEACTAIFPAVYSKGHTVIAVSSKGASPVASAWLRDRLAEDIPDRLDDILAAMAALRPVSRRFFDDQSVRRIFLHRCFDRMMAENRPLTEEEIEDVREITAQEMNL